MVTKDTITPQLRCYITLWNTNLYNPSIFDKDMNKGWSLIFWSILYDSIAFLCLHGREVCLKLNVI